MSSEFSIIDIPAQVFPAPVPCFIKIPLYGVFGEIKFFKNSCCGNKITFSLLHKIFEFFRISSLLFEIGYFIVEFLNSFF